MKKLCMILVALHSFTAFASDEQKYCDYAKEKAIAEKLDLMSPRAAMYVRASERESRNVFEIVLQENVSDFLKGNVSKKIGEADCLVYRYMNEITKHSNYDLMLIDNDINKHKLLAINTAIAKINVLLQQENKRLKSGHSTLFATTLFEQSKDALEIKRAGIQEEINKSQPVHYTSKKSLSELINLVKNQIKIQQKLLVKSQQYENWALNLGVGAMTSGPTNVAGAAPATSGGSGNGFSEIAPYVSLQVTYSLGSIARNRALKRSADAYSDWKNIQSLGPIQLSNDLKNKLTSYLASNDFALQDAISDRQKINKKLNSITRIETEDADKLRIELKIEQILNQVDYEVFNHTSVVLRNYLASNFGEVETKAYRKYSLKSI
jgi:hypothetical protein